jgi:ankyrin repeat protein
MAKIDPTGELFQAMESGDLEAVGRIASEDPASVVAPGPDGLSAVMWARYRDRTDLLEILLEASPELDVFEAAAVGWADRLRELLEADPTLVSAWSTDGYTPLHLAAFFGQGEAAKVILERGGDVTALSRNGMTVQPLHSAAAGGHRDAVAVLLDAGAPVDAVSHGGFTALHDAAQNGSLEIVELLLERGADPNLVEDQGRTARDLAIEAGHTDVALLLEGTG